MSREFLSDKGALLFTFGCDFNSLVASTERSKMVAQLLIDSAKWADFWGMLVAVAAAENLFTKRGS